MMKRQIIFLQLFLISILINANNIEQLQTEYKLRLNEWFSSEVELETQLLNLEELESKLLSSNAGWESDNLLSKTLFLQGQINQKLNNKQKSLNILEKAIKYGVEANLKIETSDTYRVLSEINSLYMVQKGMLYIMGNFSKPTDLAAKALELDPTNIRAKLIEAQFLCNAPGIAGGDFKKGINILLELANINSDSKVDNYVILYSLADSLFNKNRFEESNEYLSRALKIYPMNIDALDLQFKLNKKLGVK